MDSFRTALNDWLTAVNAILWHDIVLYIEAESPDHLARTVQMITLSADGIERTVTCHRIVLE